jgi:hypothetical protein
MGGIKAGIDFEEAYETFHHQPGADKKKQRKRYISENEHTAQAVALFADGAFAGFFEGFMEVDSGRAKSGQQPKR